MNSVSMNNLWTYLKGLRMKPERMILLLLFPTLLIGCGSGNDNEPQLVSPQEEEAVLPGENSTPEVVPFSLTDTQRNAVMRSNDFAFNLHRMINANEEWNDKSYVVSPMSLAFVLSMLNDGAVGNTSQQLMQLLGIPTNDKAAYQELCKLLIEQLPKTDEQVQMRLADLVAADKSVTMHDAYCKGVRDSYHAEVATLNFGTVEATSYVNDWCKEQTEGMIPKIVDNLRGVLAVLNAVYFKAVWSGKFDAKETTDENFTLEDGTQVSLPMMHREDYAYYYHGDIFTTLGLPYGSGQHWMMYVLLPNEGKTVADVAGALSAEKWETIAEKVKSMGMSVDVKLPRFRVESEFELNDVLKQMGATAMFEPHGEFPLITQQALDLYVTMVKQKAAVEVTEEGTEAAAVTIALITTAAGPDAEPFVMKFHAKKPFLFLIQESTSSAIPFMGIFRGM